MTYGSVCTGISAEHVAWSGLGWKAAWFSEIDPFCCALLKHHYPDVPNLGDMTDVEKFTGPIDVLVGGTPCQDFSVAGKRAGMAGERSGLALKYVELLERLRPRWLVWENVPGVLSSGGGRDFGSFIGALAECGYGVCWRILDAQFAGVAQRRRRVFVVGHLGDWRRACAVLLERESLCGNPAPRRKAGEEVTGTIGARTTAGGGFGGDFETTGGLQPVADSLNAHPGRIDGDSETFIAGTLAASGAGSARPAGQANEADMLIAETADCLTANWHRSNGAKAGNQVGVVNPVICFKTDQEPEACGDICPTLIQDTPSGGGQRPAVAYTIQTNDGGKHKRRDRPEGGLYVKEADVALAVGGTDRTVAAMATTRRGMPTHAQRRSFRHCARVAVKGTQRRISHNTWRFDALPPKRQSGFKVTRTTIPSFPTGASLPLMGRGIGH
jgi:DNA (cytosine-5)-methyltransferase 1